MSDLGKVIRRSELERIYLVLNNAREPIKVTRLSRDSRINHPHLVKYIGLLVEKGLMKKIPFTTPQGRPLSKRTRYRYVITPKGKTLCNLFERIYKMLGDNNE